MTYSTHLTLTLLMDAEVDRLTRHAESLRYTCDKPEQFEHHTKGMQEAIYNIRQILARIENDLQPNDDATA